MTLTQVEGLITKYPGRELFDHVSFKDLVFLTHPDRNPGDEAAAALFLKIQAIHTGPQVKAVVVKGAKHEYTLAELLAAGDVADVFAATGDGRDYVVKIARVAGAHAMLDAEQRHLAEVLKEAGDDAFRLCFPTLVESFPAKDKIQKRVNVFMRDNVKRHTLLEIRAKYPEVPGRHLAWIFKRLLSALGFMHAKGLVHGAVLPEHVLIDAGGHGAQLIGLGQSVRIGSPIKAISVKYRDQDNSKVWRYRDWYPPEVFAKKAATPATDIYMAGRLMRWLAGCDDKESPAQFPDAMANFFKGCTMPGAQMRPDNAWKLHDEFVELLQKIYGKPRFVRLDMS